MRKHLILKSVVAAATALVMVVLAVAPVVPVYAEKSDGNKIVITAPAGEPGESNRFAAYQIFAGVHDSHKNELNVTGWGNGVNSEALMTALKTSTLTVPDVDGSTKFGEQFTKACENYQAKFDGQLIEAAFVAEWFSKVSAGMIGRADANLYANAFARIVAGCLNEDSKKESVKTTSDSNVQWTIDLGEPGYYLVKDTYEGIASSVSSYILSVSGSASDSVHIKASTPTVDTGVVDDHGHISDGIVIRPFEAITCTIIGTTTKNLDELSSYEYVFTNIISDGLDLVYYNPNEAGKAKSDEISAIAATAEGVDVRKSANIKLYLYSDSLTKPTELQTVMDAVAHNSQGSKELVGDWTAIYKTAADGKKVLTISVEDLKVLAGAYLKPTSYIVAVYATMLNNDAVPGSAGNADDVALTYSNDPYSASDPSAAIALYSEAEPDGDFGTGTTPYSEAKVYTVGFNLAKVDGSNKDAALEGAKFKLKRWNWTSIGGEDGSGEKWNKVDGSFKGKIEWAVVETVEGAGPNGSPKYIIKDWIEDEQQATEIATDASGKLQIVGLRGLEVKHASGTDHVYRSNFALVETTIPAGYQEMEDVIFNIEILANPEGRLTKANIKIHESNEHRDDIMIMNLNGSLMNGENLATLMVRNYKEPILPLTGGIGRGIVIVSSIVVLIAGAIVLFFALRVHSSQQV